MSDRSLRMFIPGEVYSHEEIYRSLGVGNAGGIRVKKSSDGTVERAVLLTSVPEARISGENPYHDRVEGDVLVYTGAGQEGHQALDGRNKRLLGQQTEKFPIYCFMLLGSRRRKSIGPRRWRFLGLISYLRHYNEIQIDIRGNPRDVWIFEFLVYSNFDLVSVEIDRKLMVELMTERERNYPTGADENNVVLDGSPSEVITQKADVDPVILEQLRAKMLSLSPERFENIIKDVLVVSGFSKVHVTRYSQDGGIDVNAFAGERMWPLRDVLVQIQAKRWLHTVGRKEVAELRGSLQPHARGAVVTTSHFSKAALNEASEAGKQPIVLVNGHDFARILCSCKITLSGHAPSKEAAV